MSKSEGTDHIFVPRSELGRRHGSLHQRLDGLQLDMTLIATNVNLYYLAGSMQEGMLAMSGELPGPVYLARRAFDRARHESALEDVRPAVGPAKLSGALGVSTVRRLGLELAPSAMTAVPAMTMEPARAPPPPPMRRGIMWAD